MSDLRSYLDRLTPDTWRESHPFSADLELASERLWKAVSIEERQGILAEWILKNQPCLFGSIAAKNDLLRFCILDESDVVQGDQHLSDRITEDRLKWTQSGFHGEASGFVIVLLSKKAANGRPDDVAGALAKHLASLYLKRPVEFDQIEQDDIFLEYPSNNKATYVWGVGVNYFGSPGDGRWWHDHRFPGGVAFSMNSVGHMAQSGKLAKALGILEKELGIDLGTDRDPTKVDNLGTALDFAMRTIERACPTNSGRATELLLLAPDDPVRSELPCPAALPQKLAGYDYTKYRGYYHTDFTVPSLYFRPDVERPEDASPLVLDFSYLFDNRLENPDHVALGTGRRIRAQLDDSEAAGGVHDTGTKKSRMEGRVVEISESAMLSTALGRTDPKSRIR